MMGDHGIDDRNRTEILNVYYLPDGGDAKLYPAISPVNTFRIIFDTYFGANYSLLPDNTYYKGKLTEETSPACLK
jgi:hypothetical protein